MRSIIIVAVTLSVLLACGDRRGATDRDAILALYEAQRSAHLDGDAHMFLSAVDTGYVAVANGTVRFRSKADALAEVTRYFEQVHIDEVRDIAPPRVMFSADRQLAWLIGEVEVRGSQRDSSGATRPIAFRAAWLDLYAQTPIGWRLMTRANTQAPS
jgi:hypothetical protein